MTYANIERRLNGGGIVILDGGTGTELERRGVPMDAGAWCGPASLQHLDTLVDIHRDYIEVGADVITANTFASSRLMLKEAGVTDQFVDINKSAVEAAQKARRASDRDDIVVAGSLSHMMPLVAGSDRSDLDLLPTAAEIADAFGELAELLKAEGCDLILLEMMYHPARMPPAFKAATETGLPVWAGFSVRRGDDGSVLSFTSEFDMSFEETIGVLDDFQVAAAGVMHSPSDVIGDANAILRKRFDGPLTAYPDSGYFKMPNWQFEDTIAPETFRAFAEEWVKDGVQIIGGCCGLTPAHIAALAPLKDR